MKTCFDVNCKIIIIWLQCFTIETKFQYNADINKLHGKCIQHTTMNVVSDFGWKC